MTPADLLAAAAHADPARPLVTSYDETRDERTELSVATVVNWVAKIGNALADEWGLDTGDEVAIDLPAHWAGPVSALAVWNAGGEVVDPTDSATFVVRVGEVAALTDRELLLTLAPMGADLSGLVAGWPDQPVTVAPPGGVTAAARLASPGLPDGARVLSVLPFDRVAHLVTTLLAPLSADGSLVTVRGEPTTDRLAQLAATERVTHTAGCDVPGVPRLP